MNWIKCSDQLPELNKCVMIWHGALEFAWLEDVNRAKRLSAIKHKDKYPVKLEWRFEYGVLEPSQSDITHWSELPEGPNEVD